MKNLQVMTSCWWFPGSAVDGDPVGALVVSSELGLLSPARLALFTLFIVHLYHSTCVLKFQNGGGYRITMATDHGAQIAD